MAAKRQSRAARLEAALDKVRAGIEEITELKDEIENWKSGLEGTNLESSQKYEALGECEDALSSVIDELENGVSSAESVEFPGMFG